MIGLKSAAAVALAAGLIAIAAARGALAPAHVASLSGPACFVIAAVASLTLGLVGIGWHFGVRSRGAIAIVAGRPSVVDDAPETARELPPLVQRALVLAGLVAVALGALGNHAAARIVRLPEELAAPSPSAYCLPRAAEPVVATAPVVAPPVDQAGCALVRRAYQLGYAKSLGSCAPKAAAAAPIAAKAVEVCTRRQLDEPYLHYAYRRLAEAFGSVGSVSPVASIEHRVDATRAHFEHADDLLANVRHAITGSPHASHHIWIDLPDPHPGSWHEYLTGAPRCSMRFADLPLWPRWHDGDAALVVEHVLGQLLFATRFGTTASCNDYTIHWGAPVDACARLVADPIAFLGAQGALGPVRAVIDRRRRQLELAKLDTVLGRRAPAPPPSAAALVSLQCFSIDPAHVAAPTAATVSIDGEAVVVRDVHVAEVRVTADGPIDVYLELAALLAGTDVPRGRQAGTLELDDFMLTRLDELVDDDPFAGARAPLQRPELVDVYPFEHHLHAFVDAFRRRYLPQRGRL